MIDAIKNLNPAEIAGLIAALVLFFDRLSKLTANKKDDAIMGVVYKICTVFGMRVIRDDDDAS